MMHTSQFELYNYVYDTFEYMTIYENVTMEMILNWLHLLS